jgi:hypothetical protein
LISGVSTVQAREHAGAAMLMRSKPGCGTLANLSRESVDFWWPRQQGYADSPSLKRSGALIRPGKPESVQLNGYDMHIPGLYLSFISAQ